MFTVVSIDFQRVRGRIDVPEVADAVTRVEGHFSDAVEARGRGRQDFANPIGRQFQIGRIGKRGQALPTPSRKVRNQNLASDVQLRLVQDHPPPGPAAPTLEGAAQVGTKPTGH